MFVVIASFYPCQCLVPSLHLLYSHFAFYSLFALFPPLPSSHLCPLPASNFYLFSCTVCMRSWGPLHSSWNVWPQKFQNYCIWLAWERKNWYGYTEPHRSLIMAKQGVSHNMWAAWWAFVSQYYIFLFEYKSRSFTTQLITACYPFHLLPTWL